MLNQRWLSCARDAHEELLMCMKCAIVHMMKSDLPANDLPPLPPNADIEPKAVLRKAIAANRELARLKGYCSLLPNETILGLL